MVATGVPWASAALSVTESPPAALILMRRAAAPLLCRVTCEKENGSRGPGVASGSGVTKEPSAMPWRAASSSAGCSP